jgi:hypothetical protein
MVIVAESSQRLSCVSLALPTLGACAGYTGTVANKTVTAEWARPLQLQMQAT